MRLLALLLGSLLSVPSGAASLASATLDLTSPFGLPALQFDGNGVSGTSDATGATLASGSGFAGTREFPVSASPLTEIRLEVGRNDAGTFGTGSTSVTMPIHGALALVGFGGVSLVTAPIVVGTFSDRTFSGGGVEVRVQAVPWATVDTRTPGGVGSIVATSPIFITSTLGLTIPYNATLTLDYVPEPGTLLLVAAGLVGLAVRKRPRA